MEARQHFSNEGRHQLRDAILLPPNKHATQSTFNISFQDTSPETVELFRHLREPETNYLYRTNNRQTRQAAIMRLFSFLIAALTLLSGVIAVDIQKSVLITYPPETPDGIVTDAKKAIVDAGGTITHEYKLIK